MWRRTILDSVYGADVTVIISGRPELLTFLRRLGATDLDDDSQALGSTFQHRTDHFTEWIVWFPQRPSVHTLIHECLHVTMQVLRDRGVMLCRESEEAFVYYFCALYRQMDAAVSRHRPARRRRKGRRR